MCYLRSQSQLSKDGGTATKRVGVAATPKCKENAYWKKKKREDFGDFDHEFFYQHALFVGHNVTCTLYDTIKEKRGSGDLPLEKFLQMCFRQRWECPFASLYRDVRRALWSSGCTVQFI